MTTKNHIEAIQLYAGLMEEIKVRLMCIDNAMTWVGIPSLVIKEFCYLQLRMICEVIALASLVAHGDITATTKLKNNWSASKIFEQLEKLHPNFFPIPVQRTKIEPDRHHNLERVQEGFLSKAELISLYEKSCGDALHRGSLKKILKSTHNTEFESSGVVKWIQKIMTLLNHHFITLSDSKTSILCIMHNQSDGGRVQVAIAELIKNENIPA